MLHCQACSCSVARGRLLGGRQPGKDGSPPQIFLSTAPDPRVIVEPLRLGTRPLCPPPNWPAGGKAVLCGHSCAQRGQVVQGNNYRAMKALDKRLFPLIRTQWGQI